MISSLSQYETSLTFILLPTFSCLFEFIFLEVSVVGWNNTDMMDYGSDAVFKGQCRKYAVFHKVKIRSKTQFLLLNQVSLIPSVSIHSPIQNVLVHFNTISKFFIRCRLSADHLQRLNAQLTTSFNLNYWNGSQREKTVPLILEIQLPSLQDTVTPKMAHTKKISSVK